MNFKRSRISSLIDFLIPVIAIIVLMILIQNHVKDVKKMKDDYIMDFSSIITISLESSITETGFYNRARQISEYINSVENEAMFIYYENLNIMHGPDELKLNIDEGTEIHSLVTSQEYGIITDHTHDKELDMSFKWITVPGMNNRRYLVIFMVNQYVMDFTFMYLLAYITMMLALAQTIKTSLFDRIIYTKILQKNQNDLMDTFSYRNIR